MELIADILLVAGALGAGLYCFVLARRLKRFTDLEKGVGGAVSVLSAQADELKASLDAARASSDQSGVTLQALTERAETVAQRLELMMASMHDVISEEDMRQDIPEPSQKNEDVQVDTELAEPEEPAAEVVSEAQTEAKAEEQTEAPEPAKAPEGLMFFRHARPLGEGAT
ncbi:hypothetical protein [Ruegeria sp.]|uniref:hypothetical protein n=1 Tax=Ruegeria sp. TaxID=1879320 RepID=UPI002322FDE2|nr:hypothetical protein [Ruegeria sp.]MDA7965206.1 hypothetical protein [Ruegeria sp.]